MLYKKTTRDAAGDLSSNTDAAAAAATGPRSSLLASPRRQRSVTLSGSRSTALDVGRRNVLVLSLHF